MKLTRDFLELEVGGGARTSNAGAVRWPFFLVLGSLGSLTLAASSWRIEFLSLAPSDVVSERTTGADHGANLPRRLFLLAAGIKIRRLQFYKRGREDNVSQCFARIETIATAKCRICVQVRANGFFSFQASPNKTREVRRRCLFLIGPESWIRKHC